MSGEAVEGVGTMAVFQENRLWSAREAMAHVNNVFCVGRNYVNHAVELGNAIPQKPMIFGKSTHALAAAEGEVALPVEHANIHHELEIVLIFGDEFSDHDAWQQAVAGVGLGLDLTDRDAQNELKANGHPWEYAKGFRNSAVLTDVYEVNDWPGLAHETFRLEKNGAVVQSGTAAEMLFDFRTLCAFIHRRFGLSKGDIVFTGTPAGVAQLTPGDDLRLVFGATVFGEVTVV